jgi:hypothetical protein
VAGGGDPVRIWSGEHATHVGRSSSHGRVQGLVDKLERVVEEFILRWERAERLYGLQRLVDQPELIKAELQLVRLRVASVPG